MTTTILVDELTASQVRRLLKNYHELDAARCAHVAALFTLLSEGQPSVFDRLSAHPALLGMLQAKFGRWVDLHNGITQNAETRHDAIIASPDEPAAPPSPPFLN